MLFATLMWGLSRLVVLLGLLVIAPIGHDLDSSITTTPGWEAFVQWDGEHYQQIVSQGYQFKDDGKGYNVAFFPLYPLLIRGMMQLGLPIAAAGVLINTVAFWGALVMLYLWVKQRHGQRAARWATAVLAWCPFSLFGTVVYTEGLFLLGSTAALRAFDNRRYGQAMLWGALTTAIRPPAMALVPTFLIVAWREKRGAIAYLTAIVSSTGLLLYMLYCGLRFQQPLAFLLTQRGWQTPQEFYGGAWLDLLLTVLLGAANEDESYIVNPLYPLTMLLIVAIGVGLWRFRQTIGTTRAGYGFCVLAVLLWLVGGSPLITLVMVVGGGFLLWQSRHLLGRTAFVYGCSSWALLLSPGKTMSTDRYAYGVVVLAIAFGLLLSRSTRWGYWTLAFFAVLLGNLSVRFAQGLWAG
ncbi:hypothetical protein IFO70_06340 [Phormidium tenue FACHB-886]|nr:hypothetical protein [Phormidium tenue FACHB-886]